MEAELEAEQPTHPWVGGLELSLAEHGQRPVQPCHAMPCHAMQPIQAMEASGRGDERGQDVARADKVREAPVGVDHD